MGFDHFQIYFTARMWWGGKDADVDALLDEYCRLFYGPAGPKMKAFFDYCEVNYQAMEKEIEKVDTALAMLDAAKAMVGRTGTPARRGPGEKTTTGKSARPTDSVYAERLALIDSFLEALRSKARILAQGRGPVPKLRTVWEPQTPIKIDGKLDEPYWIKHRQWSVGRLRELQTGDRPVFGTTVMAGWDRGGQNVYFAIRCEERPGEKLNVTARQHDDQALFYGDAVEIELDTDKHSYYQIAVNPAGAIVDLDRSNGRQFDWQSQAEVATHVADDHWTVEIRIPVTEDENDPLNQVVGRKPSQSLPWHFNVCRQRIREHDSEYSAFAPTGTAGFHVPMKFAHFYDGRSHAFDVDDTVTDWLIEYSAASKLMRSRQHSEALAAFVVLSKHEKATDYQKSHALSQAATCARLTKDFEQAAELAKQIPLEPIAKSTQMENLLSQRHWDAVVERFSSEEFPKWPFTQVGAAALARGRAYSAVKAGEKADADLRLALEYTSDPRTRLSILRTIGSNAERVLENDAIALEAYRRISQKSSAVPPSDEAPGKHHQPGKHVGDGACAEF